VVQDGSTPLHLAARNEKLEVISLLLSSKANLEATNKVRSHG
jgi:ankyrin repeat protein